jgi:hypothetical protein
VAAAAAAAVAAVAVVEQKLRESAMLSVAGFLSHFQIKYTRVSLFLKCVALVT